LISFEGNGFFLHFLFLTELFVFDLLLLLYKVLSRNKQTKNVDHLILLQIIKIQINELNTAIC